MPRIPGGDVVPSFLGVEQTPRFYDGNNFDNYRLRIGEVQEVVYPDNKISKTKRFVEYRVLVQQRGNRTGVGKMYESCHLLNPLAGLADRAFFTLRADKSQNRDKSGLGKGSKVLIACVNGETNNAYIIGGTRDQTDTDEKLKDLGHVAYFNFNGMSFFVDADGQLVITYNGKTDIDGKTNSNVDAKATGSTIKFGKDGALLMADADAKNGIFVDHANGKVKIPREKGFEIGGATDKMLLGSSYRKAQKQLHTNIQVQFNKLQALLVAAGAAMTSASAVPAAFGVAPTGFAPAGVALTQAAGVAAQVAQLIQQFEQTAGQTTDFLSDLDKLGG